MALKVATLICYQAFARGMQYRKPTVEGIATNDSKPLQMMKLQKSIQLVPLRAGILNLQGVILTDLNQKGMAQEALQTALVLAPDLEQAKKI